MLLLILRASWFGCAGGGLSYLGRPPSEVFTFGLHLALCPVIEGLTTG
ncbi:MAG: hypothetical protein ABSE84_15040 [Isosphaeraceae bacterium]